MAPPLQLLVLLVASVATVVSRLLRVARPLASPGDSRSVKILLSVSSRDDWNAILWEHVRAAAFPRQLCFGVLIVCLDASDAEQTLDPILQSVANIQFVPRRGASSVNRTVRRLARRFIVGDESLVVVAHPRVRFLASFDATLLRLCTDVDDRTLVSVPSRSTGCAGHFPCLRREDGRRAVSRPFRTSEACLVDSVCACHELMFGRPGVFLNWGDQPRHMTTPLALVVDDAGTERDTVASPDCERHHVDRARAAGIVRLSNEQELILKFGSARAGRFAAEFGCSDTDP